MISHHDARRRRHSDLRLDVVLSESFALAFLTETEKNHAAAPQLVFWRERRDGGCQAGSALTTLPTLLLFLPLQTRMTSGLAAGSVKQ